MEETEKYPIQVVSKLTGLSTYAIRAWERRYHTLTPQRTSSNRRYYSSTEVQKLILLSKATKEGFNIGSIANLSVQSLEQLLHSNHPKILNDKTAGIRSAEKIIQTEKIIEYKQACLLAIIQLNQIHLEDILIKASIELNLDELINELIIPLIKEVGERWYDGALRIANEHLASSVLITFLQNLRNVYKSFQDGPVLISGTPQGQMHELGALIISVIAASEGWKVIYLGTNLPYREILAVSENLPAKMICMSLVYPEQDIQTKQYLIELRKNVKKEIPIIIGGRAAISYKDTIESVGTLLIENLNEFKYVLKNIKENNDLKQ